MQNADGSINVPLLAVFAAVLAPTLATVVSSLLAQRNARKAERATTAAAKQAELAARDAAEKTQDVKDSLDDHRRATRDLLMRLDRENREQLRLAQKRIEDLEREATGERPMPDQHSTEPHQHQRPAPGGDGGWTT